MTKLWAKTWFATWRLRPKKRVFGIFDRAHFEVKISLTATGSKVSKPQIFHWVDILDQPISQNREFPKIFSNRKL